MDHLERCDGLEAELADFSESLVGADWAAAVPTCDRWDVLKLVSHLGGIHRWCEVMVREVAQERSEVRHPKPEANAMAPWFAEGGQLLLQTLRAADPNAEMFAWGTDQHVKFWSRRQLHETAVHRFDAANALGRPFEMTAPVAADSIDEFLDNLPKGIHFAPNVGNLNGNDETIHLHATDAEGEWVIHLTNDGFRYEHGHHKSTVAVRGPISDLALLMWGRLALDHETLTTFGDDALMQHWLANSAL